LGIKGTILLILGILAIQGVVWLLIFRRWRNQEIQLAEEINSSGETLVIEPEVDFFQGTAKCFVSYKTYGVAALTNRSLIFRKPLGKDLVIQLSDIQKISENTWFAGNYKSGRDFLILKLKNGQEIGFMLKDQDRWVREIRSRMAL
jgi:hypothetical protein